MRNYPRFLDEQLQLPLDRTPQGGESRVKAMLAMLMLSLGSERAGHGAAVGKTLEDACNALVPGFFSLDESRYAQFPVTEQSLEGIRRAVREDLASGMSEQELIASVAEQFSGVTRAEAILPVNYRDLDRAMREWCKGCPRVVCADVRNFADQAVVSPESLPFAWMRDRPEIRGSLAQLYAECLGGKRAAGSPASPREQFEKDIADVRTGLVFFAHDVAEDLVPECLRMLASLRCKAAVLLPTPLKQAAFREKAVLDALVKSGRLHAVVDFPDWVTLGREGSFSALFITASGERAPSVRMVSFEAESLAAGAITGTGGLGRGLSEAGARLLHGVAGGAPLDKDHEAAVPCDRLLGADIGAFQASRHVLPEFERLAVERVARFGRRLGDIAQIIRALPLRRPAPGKDGRKFLEANAADINELGFIGRPRKTVELSEKLTKSFAQTQLTRGDIVLFIKGQVGACGMVGEDAGDNWIFSQSAVLIRIKPGAGGIISSTLLRYLRSDDVQTYLRRKCTVSGKIPYMLVGAVAEIPVPNLDDVQLTGDWNAFEEQKRLWKRIEKLREEMHGMALKAIPGKWT